MCKPLTRLYVVAISKKEARELADLIGHETWRAAKEHLREVQSPPTDPFYAKLYKVFPVDLPESV